MGQNDRHRPAHPPQRPARGRKTSLARRYLADHPLALVVDIDDLRMNLGQWAVREESRLLARELAIALVDCHLSAGHDVVVPQFLGVSRSSSGLQQPQTTASHRQRLS